jgi:nitroreductase
MTATVMLTTDELLTTTRAVRKRLDLTRPVERELLEECLQIAQQAPTQSNMQNWRFVVVTEPDTRAALADLFRRGLQEYLALPFAVSEPTGDAATDATNERILSSLGHLVEHLHEVPVHVIPCIGRQPLAGNPFDSAWWGSIAPAAWSFMLAARARGLGTAWTSLHLFFEQEAAEVLGIPYDEVMQAALIPVAHSIGTDFRAGARNPIDTFVAWERW